MKFEISMLRTILYAVLILAFILIACSPFVAMTVKDDPVPVYTFRGTLTEVDSNDKSDGM